MSIDWASFVLGAGIALNVCGWIYWITVASMRRADVAWRNEQRKRIDELQEWSAQRYDQARKEIGLPPRSVS